MMQRLALLIVLAVGIVSVPAPAAHAALPPTSLAKALQQVDQLLDRALRNLTAADELVDKKQMAAKDQAVDRAMRLTREAERKIETALAMVRALGSTKPSKEQLAQIERRWECRRLLDRRRWAAPRGRTRSIPNSLPNAE